MKPRSDVLLIRRFSETVMLPIFQKIAGSKFYDYLRELRRTQWFSEEELANLQNKRLRRMIRHAYETTPFYRKRFRNAGVTPDDIHSSKDLRKIPVLTKEQVRNNFADLLSRKMPHLRTELRATGGSTGEPMNFYVSQKSMDYAEATRLRGWEFSGYRFGEKSAKLWASTFDAEHLFDLKSTVRRMFHRHLLLDSNILTPESMRQKIERLRWYGPRLLMGYTSSLYRVAEFIVSNDIEPLDIPSIITGAETLYPNWRPIMREAYGGEVFNHYLTRETCVSSDECLDHAGSHVSCEVGLIEILVDGESALDECGRVIVTDFFNFAMPFIRFDLQDMATLKSETCSCGRKLPLLDKILGRVSDFVISPSGIMYNPVFFNWLVYEDPWHAEKLNGIDDYQIVQDTEDHLTVNLVATEEMPPDLPERIRKNIRRVTKYEFDVDVRLLDTMPLTQSGKRRYVISNVKPDW